MKKQLILGFFDLCSLILKIIPSHLRRKFFLLLFILESRGNNTRDSLRRLFGIEDELTRVINERALFLGRGVHPKHRLVPYHDFFIRNLAGFERILDIGCGYGAVARSIAKALPNSIVLGIDNDKDRLNQALSSLNPPNLDFLYMDFKSFTPETSFDAVVLSNVLEHIENRVEAIKQITHVSKAKKFLIRVPLFERNWTIPMRRELNVNFFQDSDHKIEHRIVEFENEMQESNLKIEKMETLWGEIWAVCRHD